MFAIKFKDDKKLCIFGYFHLYNSTEVISHLTSFNEDQYSVVANFLIIICQVDWTLGTGTGTSNFEKAISGTGFLITIEI